MIALLRRCAARAFVAMALAGAVPAWAHHDEAAARSAFQRENDAAMEQMMAGMSVPASGDIDRDFATMMIAHHQGAIDMALAQLRHGRDETLRRLAQEIVVAQQQEIAVMRMALNRLAEPAATSPPAHGHGPASRH